MTTKNFTSWTETKAKMRAIQEANGTARTPEEEAAALEHLLAEVRAHRLAEIRRMLLVPPSA